jgi:hypothetical protein
MEAFHRRVWRIATRRGDLPLTRLWRSATVLVSLSAFADGHAPGAEILTEPRGCTSNPHSFPRGFDDLVQVMRTRNRTLAVENGVFRG